MLEIHYHLAFFGEIYCIHKEVKVPAQSYHIASRHKS